MSDQDIFVYRPPHLEGDDQLYKPMFPEGPVMRASGPTLPTAQEQRSIGFGGIDYATPEQLNWDDIEVAGAHAPLDFGGHLKKSHGTQQQPAPLFGDDLRKPNMDTYVLETIENTKQWSPLRSFEESLSYPGVSFQSSMPSWKVLQVVASAFESITECDCVARPQECCLDGFIFSGNHRCEFAASLVHKGEDRWTIQLQRVSGSSIPFTNLVEKLTFFLSRIASLSNVNATKPPYDVMDFSAGAAATRVDVKKTLVDFAPLAIAEDSIHSRLFNMVESDFIEVQREGLKALADLSSSVDDRNAFLGDAKLVERVASALASPDVELKWSGSCLLANMSLCPVFCQGITDILATLFDLLLQSSVELKRVQLNVLKSIERTLEAQGTAPAFRQHTDTLQKLAKSKDSAIQNMAMLVLATVSN